MEQSMNKSRFILINVVPPSFNKDMADRDLEELMSLLETFGGADIVHVVQRRARPDPSTYIGKGKAEELVEVIKSKKIDGVIVNAIVPATKLFNLEKIFWKSNPDIKVWDRIDLILKIFEKHANTSEAKLQIDLARMGHMGPRIYGLGGTVLSRQGGGIGAKGHGETNTELMKRHWRDEMKGISDKLEKLNSGRERRMERRKDLGYKTISLVGYTNAGKTTMFNLLTGKEKKAKDELFATLDSYVGKLYSQDNKSSILLSDTIGFIQKLPAQLIEAFKSTLMESIHSDLLLIIIDASDELLHEKIEVVEDVLRSLEIGDKKKIYVFNKIDKIKSELIPILKNKYEKYSPHFVSTYTGDGIKDLYLDLQKV
ncbi:MAG: GTPase HflX [Candidatus Roizmanbacteria bacterium]